MKNWGRDRKKTEQPKEEERLLNRWVRKRGMHARAKRVRYDAKAG